MIPKKEKLFNKFYYKEMTKEELESIVLELVKDKELFEWFRNQIIAFEAIKDLHNLNMK